MGIFGFNEKTTSNINKDDITIKLDPEKQKEEENKFLEIAQGAIEDIKNCGFFNIENISILEEKIKKISVPGYGYNDPFSYDDCLSSDEKKKMGLNTRQKYSREYYNCLSEKGLKQNEPKELFKNIWLNNFHKINRKYELKRMKQNGIKTVEILDCGDERDCKKIKKLKKIWNIEEVPELPLPDCNALYCRCSYIAKEVF